ncbi:EthD family reductase [Sphaerobacter sp.]|uniref:EthD family reductase n=1 Tax=Sphaerobacter sp. TaxID=2099654 RepID=UPI001D74EFB0|nr:EthD family reductase [Sphaerobacter sp.]MBX5444799.1 EthD family reductase [Sphaerobacter sp.]
MIRVVALYKQPEDVEGFMRHYQELHTPLVRKIPGLAGLEVTRITADAFGGEAPYFLMAVMTFPDRETFDAAMRSEENRAVAKDVMGFARGLVTVMVGEDVE